MKIFYFPLEKFDLIKLKIRRNKDQTAQIYLCLSFSDKYARTKRTRFNRSSRIKLLTYFLESALWQEGKTNAGQNYHSKIITLHNIIIHIKEIHFYARITLPPPPLPLFFFFSRSCTQIPEIKSIIMSQA